VLAAEHGGEQGEVGDGRGVEGARRATVVIAQGLYEVLESTIGGGGIVDDGERIEVPMIGRRGAPPWALSRA
jgi:hypothetical protein